MTVDSRNITWNMIAGSYFKTRFWRRTSGGAKVDLSIYSQFRCEIHVTVGGVATTRSFVCSLGPDGGDPTRIVTVEMFATPSIGLIVLANTNEGIDPGQYRFDFKAIPVSGGEPKAETWFSGRVVIVREETP